MPVFIFRYHPPTQEEKTTSALMSGTVDFLTKKEDTYSASLARGLRFETVDYLKADKLAAQLTKKTQRLHFARVVNEVELDEAKQLKFQI